MKIQSVFARSILDSRGNPTVECDILLEDGLRGRAAVPSGASTGSHEALELRDGGEQYGGKGVTRAVGHINGEIARALNGYDVADQRGLDGALRQLDGTVDKSRLGANAILAVSLAAAHAAAASRRLPLHRHIAMLSGTMDEGMPVPMVNVLNGGRHAAGSTDIQEYMIVPQASTMAERVRRAAEVFHALGEVLREQGLTTLVGDEGGYAPTLGGNERALDLIMQAIERAGYRPGDDIMLALDVAASELFVNGSYSLPIEGAQRSAAEMIDWYTRSVEKYPIMSIEDGLDENDWSAWQSLTQQLGGRVALVGDDLLVTNTSFLQRAISERACNSILIKPNQIGTLTETLDAIAMAKQAGFRVIVSHRSGETEDVSIAHIVVGCNTGYIKTGSMSRGERTAKYNELLRIAESVEV